ncbi:MAG TPA: ZIP family metal transporter [Firmicutes bacterium]|nr:ZIP family metal transporter [Bacillota bacterium]
MTGQVRFLWLAVFALGAMLVNSTGIWVMYRNKEWAEKNKEYFMCFAAGMLIASPLIAAFSEAIELHQNAGLAALLGFVFMFFSNKFIKYKTKKEVLAFGITALEGIGLHSLLDGIIYTVTFNVSVLTGVIAGLGLVVHEFAEGVITFSILVQGGIEDRKAFLYAFLVASLTTPLGAFLAFPLVSTLSGPILGLALGFVVGVLIYVSASHILPEASAHEKKHSYLAFVAGIALAILILLCE